MPTLVLDTNIVLDLFVFADARARVLHDALDRFNVELEFGAILGTPYLGTGGDPTNAGNRNIEPWTLAGEKWRAAP